MPICIECQHPVKTLWTKYSGGGGGHNIRLTVCKNCGRFCDKYVEHDFVVLFIDLVLIKPQVYRHLLHNSLMREGDRFDPAMLRLGVLLLLFDVYLTWARIEKQFNPPTGEDGMPVPTYQTSFGRLATQPIVLQYVFFLGLCSLSNLAFHLSIRFLTSSAWSPMAYLLRRGRRVSGPPGSGEDDADSPGSNGSGGSGGGGGGATTTTTTTSNGGLDLPYPRPNSVSTALLVSSSTKLFPILMVIWEYDVPAAARSLGWAVVVNNVEALKILLDCNYGVAALLTTAGALSRWAVSSAFLWAAGFEGVDSAGETSVTEDGKALWALLITARDWAGRLVVG